MKSTAKPKAPTQKEHRRGVTVGPGAFDVSPVMYWYRHNHFANDDEARGAFKIAYQQGMDGMGESVAAWMGMTDEEFNAWMRTEALPSKGHGPSVARRDGAATVRGKVIIGVWGPDGAAGWNIYGPDGRDPTGDLHPDARAAVDHAVAVHGGIAYHPSDGDVWIDLESDGGDLHATLGAAVSFLTGKGYEVIVREDRHDDAGA